MKTKLLTLFWGMNKKKPAGDVTLQGVHRLISTSADLKDITAHHRADRQHAYEADRRMAQRVHGP